MQEHHNSGNTPDSREASAVLSLFVEGRYIEALALVQSITARFPFYALGWTVFGAVCNKMGQGEAALVHMQKALALSPNNPNIHAALGNIFQTLERQEEAEACFLRAIEINPDHAEANNDLGLSYQRMHRPEEAESSFLRALQIKPDYVAAYFNLGITLKDSGRLHAAEANYRLALQFKPDFVEALSNLGAILLESGRLNEAENCYRQALQIRPDYAELHSNLGNVLRDLGQLDGAVASYRQALEINPDSAEVLYNLCNALQDLGQLGEAVISYCRALEMQPDCAEVYNNLGVALKKLGQLDGAAANCGRALQIKPDFAEAYCNLGGILKDAGRIDEAIACDRRALELAPDNIKIHSNLVYSIYFHPGFDERSILEEAKRFASVHLPPPPLSAKFQGRCEYTATRRLRIGYVSPDFRNHCQSMFTIPLLSNHDHTRFEIFCYAQLVKPDEISERLASYAEVWRFTNGINDVQLAEMIESDGIDILVDLTMHMSNGRPLLFARKPAPVQLAWLAYPGTTGNPAMDYRITDPWLDPPGRGDEHYSETSIRLPDTFWCYDPLITGLSPNSLPALTAGYITFGCLNNFCKVSDDTLRSWGQVMASVPSSRLILRAPAGMHRLRVLGALGRYGVVENRIEFVEFQPRAGYLRTYHRIDLCLDTLPYNGHTTSLDAYWMGVPVITQVGRTVVGRAGWSQLNNLGLSELAALDEQSFVHLACALATDLPRLNRLRQTLRQRLEESALMNGQRFAQAIENVYLQVWGRACVMLAPQPPC